MDKKNICPCGLICTDCLFHKPEMYKTAEKLQTVIKESQLDVFFASICENESWKMVANHLNADQSDFKKHFEAFNNFDSFMTILNGLAKLQCKSTCRESGGCSVGGELHKCEAVKCVTAKELQGCWECSENDQCKKLNFVKMVYGDTITETFSIMKAEGETGVKSYGKNYYAWQRNSPDDSK